MLKIIHILTLVNKLMIKILNFKLVIMYEYQNAKTFLLKDILKGYAKKVKNTVPWTYVINDINGEKNFGSFNEKELQKKKKKKNQEEFIIEKVIKRKGDKLYVKWKGYDDSFNSWIDKKDIV